MRSGSAYDLLLYRLVTYQRKASPDNTTRYHGHLKDPVDVVNFYLSVGIRGGLSGEQIRRAFAESGLEMPGGVMSLGRLLTLDLTQQRDSWTRRG